MSQPSLIQRLGERQLVQWAIAYLAGAWVVFEVADSVGGRLGWPDQLYQGLLTVLGVGLLVTLVLAWYHGEKGRQRVSGPELLMLAVLFAIGGGVVSVVGGGRSTGADSTTERRALPMLEDTRPSIAVLPFADMSPEGDQEYFADGVAEEILNAITRIPGLRVAARTSAFSFKGANADIRMVGERLSVATVLEGSVRKEGDHVRITAQLIDATNGFHIWSDSYDRRLESVFAVQDEIAREIVRELQVELVGPEIPSLDIPTTSPEAYEAYLRARHALGTATTRGWHQAVGLLEQAIGMDSAFAPAHSSLAMAHILLGWFGEEPFPEAVAVARQSASRALELDDQVSDAYAVLGYVALYHDWNWPAADRWFRQALELNPNDALARHGYGDLLSILGDGEEGLRQVEMGRAADPLSALAVFPVVGHKVFLHRFDEVIREVDSLRALFPGMPEPGRIFVGQAYWYSGQRTEALDLWSASWSDPELSRAVERGVAEGGPLGAMRAWADYRARQTLESGGDPYDVAVLYARAQVKAQAFDWLERAYDERSWSLLHVTLEPAFDELRSEPEYRGLLERMGIPDASPGSGPTGGAPSR